MKKFFGTALLLAGVLTFLVGYGDPALSPSVFADMLYWVQAQVGRLIYIQQLYVKMGFMVVGAAAIFVGYRLRS